MDWLEIAGPTILVIVGGIIAWFVKDKTEALRAAEERLREDRRANYLVILEPYATLLTGAATNPGGVAAVQQQVRGEGYRKAVFEMMLFAEDNVISAYNRMLRSGAAEKPDGVQMIRDFANLLREVRRSLGYTRSKLSDRDILRGLVIDVDQYLK